MSEKGNRKPNERITRDLMTKVEAEALGAKWKQQVDPPACEHVTQEMETSNGHYLTGRYHCLVCGETVDHP